MITSYDSPCSNYPPTPTTPGTNPPNGGGPPPEALSVSAAAMVAAAATATATATATAVMGMQQEHRGNPQQQPQQQQQQPPQMPMGMDGSHPMNNLQYGGPQVSPPPSEQVSLPDASLVGGGGKICQTRPQTRKSEGLGQPS